MLLNTSRTWKHQLQTSSVSRNAGKSDACERVFILEALALDVFPCAEIQKKNASAYILILEVSAQNIMFSNTNCFWKRQRQTFSVRWNAVK